MIEITTAETVLKNTPLVTDWLMLLVTFVYVVATIFIYKANIESACAAREQIEESRRQFKETTRLNLMPFFEFEVAEKSIYGSEVAPLNLVIPKGDAFYASREYIIRNIGLGTAKNITYRCINLTESLEGDLKKVSAIKSNDLKYITLDYKTLQKEKIKLLVIVHFQDLLNNNYTQNIEIEVVNIKEITAITILNPIFKTA